MSLFKAIDLLPENVAKVVASAVLENINIDFISVKNNTNIAQVLGDLKTDKAVFYRTCGAWSNINLLQYILKITGKADVYFSTWAISINAIRVLIDSEKNELINNYYGVLDAGIRNRKPEIYQQIIANFKNYCFAKCHAKVMVIKNQKFSFTIVGSANLTANPRIETGMIILNLAIAEENINWILKEINNAKTKRNSRD